MVDWSKAVYSETPDWDEAEYEDVPETQEEKEERIRASLPDFQAQLEEGRRQAEEKEVRGLKVKDWRKAASFLAGGSLGSEKLIAYIRNRLKGMSNADAKAKADRDIETIDEAKEKHPGYALAGALATAVPTAGAGLAKATPTIGKAVLQGAKFGGGVGALERALQMEDPEEIAKGALTGAGMGVAFGALGHGLTKAAGVTRKAAEKGIEKAAYRGFTPGQIGKFDRPGQKERVAQWLREAKAEGRGPREAREYVKRKLLEVGRQKEGVVSAYKDKLPAGEARGQMQRLLRKYEGIPEAKRYKKEVVKEISRIGKQPFMSLKDVDVAKQRWYEMAGTGKKAKHKIARRMSDIYRQLGYQAEKGGPENLRRLNQQYGDLKMLDDAMNRVVKRLEGKDWASPEKVKDMIMEAMDYSPSAGIISKFFVGDHWHPPAVLKALQSAARKGEKFGTGVKAIGGLKRDIQD